MNGQSYSSIHNGKIAKKPTDASERSTAASNSNRSNLAPNIYKLKKKDSPLTVLQRWISFILLKTCLRPNFYLRRQLFLSFGTTAIAAILFFVCIGALTAIWSGNSVMEEAGAVQRELARHTLGTSARYVAETVTKKFNNYETASGLLREVTRDRIVGYKTPAFLDPSRTDQLVPFFDRLTGQAQYPLKTPDLMVLDWNSSTSDHLGEEDEDEIQNHFQSPIRFSWYAPELQVSTAHAAYFMQGTCNVSASPSDPAYYPNCTAANNDLSTGGAVRPTRTNYLLSQKAADMTFVLKAIYESHTTVKSVGVYFANEGAGSYIRFPAHIRDGRTMFTSIGCEWMGTTINPLTGRFIGTREEIQNCHDMAPVTLDVYNISSNETTMDLPSEAPTETFPSREYNAMERPWCARQAQAPQGYIVSTGPYPDASGMGGGAVWVITFGHGVFDRVSKEFIGCTLIDFSVDDLLQILEGVQVGYSSQVALIRWDDFASNTKYNVGTRDKFNRPGIIVGATQWDPSSSLEPTHITDPEINMGVDDELFDRMRNLVNYDTTWDPNELNQIYNQTMFRNNGRLVMMYPVPYLPAQYVPDYRPEFMIVMSISQGEIFDESAQMDDHVWQDIKTVVRDISLIGVVGLLLIYVLLGYISRTLTEPLLWMQKMTAQVINNAGGEDLTTGITSNGAAQSESLVTIQARKCSPNTEVSVLLSEFEMMMDGFSGAGAAEVADKQINQVKNEFVWREAFQVLYPYNFGRTSSEDSEGSDGDEEENKQSQQQQQQPTDIVSVGTEVTLLSALTESSIVQAILRQPKELSSSVTTTVMTLANAGYAAGVEKLPGWAKEMLVKEEEDVIPDYVVSPPKVNLGSNIKSAHKYNFDAKREVEKVSTSSRLFIWITCLIGIPILLTACFITFWGEFWIRNSLDVWLADVREASYALEKDSLVSVTRSRASFGEEVMFRFLRDLHLYSRVAGWLLFGALQRSGMFSEMRSGAQECKVYDASKGEICPFKENQIPCDCAWNDPYVTSLEQCTFYGDKYDSRVLQQNIMEGQQDDIDSSTGNRNSTSFPSVASTPEQTSWWASPEEMPGSEKGVNASGYKTVYDRVRVLSALSVVHMPLYNYYPGRDEDRHLGSYIGLEADGMVSCYPAIEDR
jgi:hypothetical protein